MRFVLRGGGSCCIFDARTKDIELMKSARVFVRRHRLLIIIALVLVVVSLTGLLASASPFSQGSSFDKLYSEEGFPLPPKALMQLEKDKIITFDNNESGYDFYCFNASELEKTVNIINCYPLNDSNYTFPLRYEITLYPDEESQYASLIDDYEYDKSILSTSVVGAWNECQAKLDDAGSKKQYFIVGDLYRIEVGSLVGVDDDTPLAVNGYIPFSQDKAGLPKIISSVRKVDKQALLVANQASCQNYLAKLEEMNKKLGLYQYFMGSKACRKVVSTLSKNETGAVLALPSKGDLADCLNLSRDEIAVEDAGKPGSWRDRFVNSVFFDDPENTELRRETPIVYKNRDDGKIYIGLNDSGYRMYYSQHPDLLMQNTFRAFLQKAYFEYTTSLQRMEFTKDFLIAVDQDFPAVIDAMSDLYNIDPYDLAYIKVLLEDIESIKKRPATDPKNWENMVKDIKAQLAEKKLLSRKYKISKEVQDEFWSRYGKFFDDQYGLLALLYEFRLVDHRTDPPKDYEKDKASESEEFQKRIDAIIGDFYKPTELMQQQISQSNQDKSLSSNSRLDLPMLASVAASLSISQKGELQSTSTIAQKIKEPTEATKVAEIVVENWVKVGYDHPIQEKKIWPLRMSHTTPPLEGFMHYHPLFEWDAWRIISVNEGRHKFGVPLETLDDARYRDLKKWQWVERADNLNLLDIYSIDTETVNVTSINGRKFYDLGYKGYMTEPLNYDDVIRYFDDLTQSNGVLWYWPENWVGLSFKKHAEGRLEVVRTGENTYRIRVAHSISDSPTLAFSSARADITY